MTTLPSQEQLELLKGYVRFYKLSDAGCNIPNTPLLDVEKLDFTLFGELMDLIDIYFRFSGQKGLGLEEVRGGVLKPLCSSYINRGLVYLAFLFKGYALQKEKTQNPHIRCRYVNLKDYTERHQHTKKLAEFIRYHKETPPKKRGTLDDFIRERMMIAATNEEPPS